MPHVFYRLSVCFDGRERRLFSSSVDGRGGSLLSFGLCVLGAFLYFAQEQTSGFHVLHQQINVITVEEGAETFDQAGVIELDSDFVFDNNLLNAGLIACDLGFF